MFSCPAFTACYCRRFICVTSSHTQATCGGRRGGEGLFTVSSYSVSETPSEIALLFPSYRSRLRSPLSYSSNRPLACLQHQWTKSITNGRWYFSAFGNYSFSALGFKRFFCSQHLLTSPLGRSKSSVKWVPALFPGVEAPVAWRWSVVLSSAEFRTA
jgi:hypothetical protein